MELRTTNDELRNAIIFKTIIEMTERHAAPALGERHPQIFNI